MTLLFNNKEYQVNTKSQIGSSQIVIIAVLAILILGALGYVFWNNFNDNAKTGLEPTATVTQNPEDISTLEPEIALKSANFDDVFDTDMSFNYPENWTYSTSIDGPIPFSDSKTTSEQVYITSPSKSYSVHYELVNGGGIGGLCDEDSPAKIKTYSYEQLKSYAGLHLVTYTSQSNDTERVRGYAGLMQTNEFSKPFNAIKVGDANCNVFLREFITKPNGKSNLSMRASILPDSLVSIKGLDSDNVLKGTGTQFEAAFKGKEFEQAKNILLSTSNQ